VARKLITPFTKNRWRRPAAATLSQEQLAAAESNREKRSIESSQLERHQLKLNRVPRSVLPDGCFLITLPAVGDEHCWFDFSISDTYWVLLCNRVYSLSCFRRWRVPVQNAYFTLISVVMTSALGQRLYIVQIPLQSRFPHRLIHQQRIILSVISSLETICSSGRINT